MAEQGPTFNFGFDGDEGSAKTEADRMAKVVEGAFLSAFKSLGPQLAKALSKGVSGAGGSKKIFNEAQQSATDFVSSAAKQTARLEADFTALNNRIEATRDTLRKAGLDPHLFAVFDQAINASMSNLREFDAELARGTATPEKFKQLNESAQASLRLAQKEVAGIQSEAKLVGIVQGKALESQRAQQQQAATARLRADQQAHGKYIAAYQREGAQTLAETRIAGQRIIQQDRQTQRVRVETLRFAFNQIRNIERSIGSVFRGSAAVTSGAFARVESTVFRIGGIFKRSNRDLNDGLRPALLSRERSLSRSFSNQSETVSRSLRQQSVALERFETQSSKGVIGALSGRSRVGTALGLGAGIGGGFALFQGIKNGIKIGGDFVQGLAVLQAQLGLTAEQMQAVREQSIELGNDISLPGVSALDAAEAIQILSKHFAVLGAEALPTAQKAARAVLQLSRASGASAEEAGRIVGAAVNVFGVAADEATKVADQITNALTKGAGVTFADFADSFVQGAGVFKLFVGPGHEATATLTEFNAALDILAKGGLTGSQAGAALKQFFIQANRGTKDSKKALKLVLDTAGETGTLFFDAEGKARSFTETLSILREGIKGLNDQTRSTTLQKLFGSRATTAANLFVNTTAAEFDNLTTSIEKTGSAAEIAAAQNTGLRGSLDALQSVIETQQIKTYEKYQGVIGKVVLRFADLLNAFFEGRGAFRFIRAGLAGLATALGGLLVLKTATEGIKILIIALTGLGSPLGVIVTAIGLLGAAIGVLSAASPDFRSELGKIADTLKTGLGDKAGEIGDRLGDLSRFVRTRVIPDLAAFGVGLSRRVVPFVDATIDRIRDLVSLLKGEFATALGGLRAGLAGEGLTGAGGLAGFGERVGITLRQAAIGVEAFTAALRGREFTSVLTGAGVLNEERQTTFVKFFETLGSSLRTTAERISHISTDIVHGVAEAFREGLSPTQLAATFGAAALGTALGGPIGLALGAAIGFALSSFNFSGIARKLADAVIPQLQAFLGFVVDFLGGTAATAGGRLGGAVQGFLVGPFQQAVGRLGFFLGNLLTDPRLVQAITKLLALAALTGANFAKGFVQGAISNLPGLMNGLAATIDDLFWGAIQSAFNDPLRFAKIIAGVFLARSLFRAFTGAGEQGAKGIVAGFSRGLQSNVALHPNFVSGFFGGPGALEAQATAQGARVQKALTSEFDKINRDLGRLGRVSVLPRNDLGIVTGADVAEASERLNRVKGKIGEVGAAGLIARQRFREGFRGISDDFNDLSRLVGGKGRAIGSILGTGIMAGVGAALSGQQLGGASSAGGKALGLAGILGAALIPLITLPTTIGVPLAGITLGIGLLTAAFHHNDDAAKETAASIQGFVDVIKNANSLIEASPLLAGSIADTLLDQGADVQRVLQQAGFNVRDFTDDAVAGQATLAGTIRDLTRGLGVDQRRVDAFVASEVALGHSGKQAIDDLSKAVGGNAPTNQAQALALELRNAGADGNAVIDILTTLFDKGGEVQTAIGRVATRSTLLAHPIDTLHDSFQRLGGQIGITARQAGNSQLDRYIEQLTTAGVAQLDELNRKFGLVGQAIDSLNEKRVSGINTRIGEVTAQLDAAKTAAEEAFQAILDVIAPETDTAQQALGDLVQSIPNIAETLGDTLAQAGKGDIQAQFGLQDLVDQFGGGLRDAVTKAFTENPALTPQQLRGQIAGPIQTALNQARVQIGTDDATGNPIFRALTPAEQQFFQDQLSGLFDSGLDVAIEQFQISQTAVSNLQDQLDKLNATLQVRVEFKPSQVLAELHALESLGLITGALPSLAEIVAAQEAARHTSTPVGGTTADRIEQRIENGVQINQTNNIVEATPVRTQAEITSGLRAAAASGKLGFAALTGATK